MHSSFLMFSAAAFFFVMIISGAAYASRQRARMKRSKEILDRYNPERSKHPSGL
jgi:hypothetical protein